MNKFFSLLKTLFASAPVVVLPLVQTFAPAFAPLTQLLLTSILSAQAKVPQAGAGSTRAELALTMVAAQAPELIASIEKATGKKLVDEKLFATALSSLNDSYVAMLNAFEALPKGEK